MEPFFRVSNSKKLRVLAYHKVENFTQFEKQIDFLNRNYNIIKVELLEKYFKGEAVLEDNSVLITFDDGDISVYKNALPVLKKYNLPAVLFIVTNLINSQDPFWWDEVEYYLNENGNETVWALKDVKNSERIDFIDNLRKNSGKDNLIYQQLTSSDLFDLHTNNITISNHSHTHPMFDRCTSSEITEELDRSINFLKSQSLAPFYFAYPNGNYDEDAERLLAKKNIKLAFLFDHKLSDLKNPLRISRIRVNASSPISEFKVKVSGLHSFLYN